jgi:hypothetical protein
VLGVSPVALVRHEEVKAQVGPDSQTAREIPLAQICAHPDLGKVRPVYGAAVGDHRAQAPQSLMADRML